MATDYLESKFPTYVLTADESVVPFKTYYKRVGEHQFTKVLDPVAEDLGSYYELTRNRFAEFHFGTETYQMNNVAHICRMTLKHLDRFPKMTLPRETEVAPGVKIDWRENFHDTVWAELIGDRPVFDYTAPFTMCLSFGQKVNPLLVKIVNASTLSSVAADLQAIKDTIVEGEGATYSDYGWAFNPKTLGSTTRDDDLFTCVYVWSEIDFRKAQMILQNASTGAPDYSEMIDSILDGLHRCARTIVCLGQLVSDVCICDASVFTCKLVNVPKTLTKDGVTYYRLVKQRQLVEGAVYGEAKSTQSGSIVLFSTETVSNPVARFAFLNLPTDPGEIKDPDEIQKVLVQHGKVWYTTINPEG